MMKMVIINGLKSIELTFQITYNSKDGTLTVMNTGGEYTVPESSDRSNFSVVKKWWVNRK